MKRRTVTDQQAKRITWVGVFFLLLMTAVVVRLFDLQVLRGDFFAALAEDQHSFEQRVIPERGEIFVRDRGDEDALVPVAINRDWWMLYAVPKDVEDIDQTIRRLREVVTIEESMVRERLAKRNDPYEPLLHRVSEEEAEALRELNMPGLQLQREQLRFYPEGSLFAPVTGFVGFRGDERVGQYGVEGFYDNVLGGAAGLVRGEQGVRGIPILFGNQTLQEAKDGEDIVLTIDATIQFVAAKELAETVDRYDAERGSVVVMHPKTGAILALATTPTFDANRYWEVDSQQAFLNPIVNNRFEPGSIFKPFTVAAALEQSVITPETVYTDEGSLSIAGYTIRNADGEKHGRKTMTEALELSLNTGAVFMQRAAGKEAFRTTLENFGFSRKTEVDLFGEAIGDINNLRHRRDIEYATASFGQGVAVTPIAITRAFAAIANGGELVRPHVTEAETRTQGRAISQQTAAMATSMMVSVVDNGFGRKARVPGYAVAGKTGTAQIPDSERGGYLDDATIHSFAGFAPAHDPQFVMLVILERPQGVRFSSDSAAPVWGRIAKFILQYLNVPPSD